MYILITTKTRLEIFFDELVAGEVLVGGRFPIIGWFLLLFLLLLLLLLLLFYSFFLYFLFYFYFFIFKFFFSHILKVKGD